MLGLVIVGALILVAVKQSQPADIVEVERQRDLDNGILSTTAATIVTTNTTSNMFRTMPTADDTESTQPPDDQFQSKLVILEQLVAKCKEISGNDPYVNCERLGPCN